MVLFLSPFFRFVIMINGGKERFNAKIAKRKKENKGSTLEVLLYGVATWYDF